jgi:hypothetical protein
MNRRRSLCSDVIIKQPEKDNNKKHTIDQILEQCFTRKDTRRKAMTNAYAHCLASAPRCDFSGMFLVCSIQVPALERLLVD